MIQAPAPPARSQVLPNSGTLQFDHAVRQGQLFLESGHLMRAIAHFQDLVADYPNQASLHFQLGIALDQQGNVSSAIDCYRRVIQLSPHHANALNNLGCALLKQGDIQVAIEVFNEAIAHHPQQAFLYNNLGRAQDRGGQIEEAIASFRRAIHLQPNLVEAHLNLGGLWHRLNQRTDAIQSLQQVVELDPLSTQAWSRLGQWQLNAGNIHAGLECWHEILQLHPQRIRFFCDRTLRSVQNAQSGSYSRDELHQLARLVARFLSTLDDDCRHPDLPLLLAEMYWRLGKIGMEVDQPKQAEVYFRTSLNLQPECLEAWLALGECLVRQHRYDAAIALSYLALQAHPNEPRFHQRIGHCLEQQNRPQQAIAAYRAALHLSSQSPSRKGAIALPPLEMQNCKKGALPEYGGPSHLYPSTLDWTAHTTEPGVRYIPVSPADAPNGSHSPALCSLPPTLQETCGGVTCSPCMASLRRAFEPTQICTNGFECTHGVTPDLPPCPTFVVTIPQGRAWIAPKRSDWVICNRIGIVTPDGGLLSDLSRAYPWYLPGCDRHHPTQHPFLKTDVLPPVESISGRVAVLSGLSGHIYYHWMMDVLPRFELLRRSGLQWENIDYFVVNSVDQPFQRQTLEILGIPLEKVIASDRHPHLLADQLIVPSFPGHLDWVPSSSLHFLRNTLLPHAHQGSGADEPCPEWPKRIYISRNRARYRRVINEAAVMQQLEPIGFVSVELESLSVKQQARLFAQAERIVAPHGAGLTNLAFCQPGTHVVELTAPTYMRTDYWIVSHHLGLRHSVIRGKPFDCEALRQFMYQGSLAEDIEVPIDALQAMILHLDWGSP